MQRPLRFTWELHQPAFYLPAEPNGTPSPVIIADRNLLQSMNGPGATINITASGIFDQQTGVFRYKTVVAILPP